MTMDKSVHATNHFEMTRQQILEVLDAPVCPLAVNQLTARARPENKILFSLMESNGSRGTILIDSDTIEPNISELINKHQPPKINVKHLIKSMVYAMLRHAWAEYYLGSSPDALTKASDQIEAEVGRMVRTLSPPKF